MLDEHCLLFDLVASIDHNVVDVQQDLFYTILQLCLHHPLTLLLQVRYELSGKDIVPDTFYHNS